MPVKYGGFWRRVVAYFIDSIILSIGLAIVEGIFGFGMGMDLIDVDASGQASFAAGYLGFAAFNLIAPWLYFAVLESSSWQGTLGKKALGMIVTDLDGNRISFGRATGRYFAKILSALIMMIGFIMVAFTARKQGLHDMIAGTLVYKATPPELVSTNVSVFE